MAKIKVDSVTRQDQTITVIGRLTDPTGTQIDYPSTPISVSYSVTQFIGMTRAQIRSFIVADLKSKYQPTLAIDITDTSGFVPGEIVDLSQ
jgi:hypothetical protein